MICFYRLTNIKSTNPSPILNDDKFRLNKLCLKSFVLALKDIKPKIYFLADYCGKEYDELFKQEVPFPYEVEYTALGINGTCLKQYEMAKEQDEDILFLEGDYVWRPSGGQPFVDGLNELGLVSPYDNLNFYIDKSIHSEDVKIKLLGDQHWRSVERVTMTFAVKNKIFKDNYEIFRKYGYLDNDVWHELRAKGYQMWTPVPSLNTHMVKDYMAPAIPWNLVFDVLNT